MTARVSAHPIYDTWVSGGGQTRAPDGQPIVSSATSAVTARRAQTDAAATSTTARRRLRRRSRAAAAAVSTNACGDRGCGSRVLGGMGGTARARYVSASAGPRATRPAIVGASRPTSSGGAVKDV